uniref:Leptin-like n=1 Tax=Cyprinodon variegatus TaxID=28743 RepID=A0A3Q2FRC3_CYPVA
MDYTWVILFSLLHVLTVGTGMPLPEDKSNIDQIIRTLMVRLKKFKVCYTTTQHLIVTPPTELQGFSSIVESLKAYNRSISDNLMDVSQVKTDISKLANTITNKWMNCTARTPEIILPKRLRDLQEKDPNLFESVTEMAVHGLKEILKLLQENFDSIASC